MTYIIGKEDDFLRRYLLKAMPHNPYIINPKNKPKKSVFEKISDLDFLRKSCGVEDDDKGRKIKFRRYEKQEN